jgi:hypothetical protein
MRLGYFGLVLVIATTAPGGAADAPTSFPRFRAEEIDKSLKVGYAVKLVDLNGDGKKDIIVVDSARIVWFENPTWKLHTIIQGQTKPDNVCIDAHDIDGDGQLDLALGADWKPFNTKEGGTLQWLRRGKNIDDPWTVYPIDTEPTVHRIYFADIDGNGKPRLILGPLMGRNSTKEKNWSETPVRVLAFKIPKDPTKDRWVPEVLDESRHVMHNFWPVDLDGNKELDILTASYEGLSLLTRTSGQWTCQLLGQGNQDKPDGNRGCSEVKLGRLKNGRPYVATIEPWHGHQVVVYTPPENTDNKKSLWTRQVIDDQLKWGHAVWCADLDGDGDEELIIGVRDPLNDKVRYGVNVYKATDAKATKWQKHVVENGGVAVEDLAAADLNGDGRIDIVAVGRATGNVKIYWNEGLAK